MQFSVDAADTPIAIKAATVIATCMKAMGEAEKLSLQRRQQMQDEYNTLQQQHDGEKRTKHHRTERTRRQR